MLGRRLPEPFSVGSASFAAPPPPPLGVGRHSVFWRSMATCPWWWLELAGPHGDCAGSFSSAASDNPTGSPGLTLPGQYHLKTEAQRESHPGVHVAHRAGSQVQGPCACPAGLGTRPAHGAMMLAQAAGEPCAAPAPQPFLFCFSSLQHEDEGQFSSGDVDGSGVRHGICRETTGYKVLLFIPQPRPI